MNDTTRKLMEKKGQASCDSSYTLIEGNIYLIGHRKGAEAMEALMLEREEKKRERLESLIHTIRAVAFEIGQDKIRKATDEILYVLSEGDTAADMWRRESEYRSAPSEREEKLGLFASEALAILDRAVEGKS